MKRSTKPVNGHKMQSVSYGVCVNCECGWASSMWLGKGARSQAMGEFANHKERHRPFSERITAAREAAE